MTTFEVLEYTAELGERFPSLTIPQLLNSVEDFVGRPVCPDTALAHALEVAYNKCSATAAAMYIASTYGIEVSLA